VTEKELTSAVLAVLSATGGAVLSIATLLLNMQCHIGVKMPVA
jgi:hypothetical protein